MTEKEIKRLIRETKKREKLYREEEAERLYQDIVQRIERYALYGQEETTIFSYFSSFDRKEIDPRILRLLRRKLKRNRYRVKKQVEFGKYVTTKALIISR